MRKTKEYLIGRYPLDVSTTSAIASRWLIGRVFGLGDQYLNEFVPKISSVDRKQVQAAIKKHFDLDKLVIVVSGDVRKN